MQRFQTPYCSSSSSVAKPHTQMNLGAANASQMQQSLSPEHSKRPGIPPSHPNNPLSLPNNSQFIGSRSVAQKPGSLNLNPKPSHSRSLSQPEVFSFDCVPPLSPLSLEQSLPSPANAFQVGQSIPPPRKGHRRSNSDTPLGFSDMIQSSPQLLPIGTRGVSGRENLGVEKPIQLVKRGLESIRDCNSNGEELIERKCEGEVVDALLSEYINFDGIDRLNLSGTEDKDLDSKVSGSKTNGGESSDNEVESRVNGSLNQGANSSFSIEKREGVKRSANGDIAPTGGHYRSVSMDSLLGNLNFDEESPKLQLSVGTRVGQQHSPSNSMDGNSIRFNLEFGKDGFSAAELEKIRANEKLAEIALSDPKRAKRILANRISAARSKERKNRHTSELEHKVKILETEIATLSTQVSTLQREAAGLSSENNELKFRLQAKEQQAQLKDALNEALSAEVQRLKLAVAEFSGNFSNQMAQQISINHQMFQLPRQQPTHLNIYQLQQQQQHQTQQLVQLQPQQLQHSQPEPHQQNGKATNHQLNQ